MKSKTKWQEIRKEETTSKWLWQCRSLPAPDSEEIGKIEPPYTPVNLTPKTPAKSVSSKKTPKSKKKLQLEENTEYTTPRTGKTLRFTDDEDVVHIISPVPPESPCRLPVKKSKVKYRYAKKPSTPWVAGLNCKYKLMLENNSWLCSEIINTCMNIIAQQFPHTSISGFQPTGLVPYCDDHTVLDRAVWEISATRSTIGTNTPHRKITLGYIVTG